MKKIYSVILRLPAYAAKRHEKDFVAIVTAAEDRDQAVTKACEEYQYLMPYINHPTDLKELAVIEGEAKFV